MHDEAIAAIMLGAPDLARIGDGDDRIVGLVLRHGKNPLCALGCAAIAFKEPGDDYRPVPPP